MRLLRHDAAEGISFTVDLPRYQLPPYAILSHTWGRDSDEVTFWDIINKTGTSKPGYDKILFCMRQAYKDGLRYVWIDTCCINKTDSSELSITLNSMYDWYANAERCYVYLSDVHQVSPGSTLEASFRASRWFTRGWTLQELLAPKSIEFFSRNGERLGSRESLETLISEVTLVPAKALRGSPLAAFSIEERFDWQTLRDTKREEDRWYSLLGIMGVSMPIIYGEGRMNAFRRLKSELAFQDKFFSELTLDESLSKINPTEATEDHQTGTNGMPTLSRTSSASSMDTVFSMASVASSVSSVGTIVLPENIINHFVELLFCTPDLLSIHSSAISEQGVGEMRYQRNLRRMIARYGKALRSETGSAKILPAARLLQSKKMSVRAARSIIWKAGQESRKHQDSPHDTRSDYPSSSKKVFDLEDDFQDDASVVSSSEDEPELPQDTIDERAVAEYMKGTHAFLQFKAQLLDFAHLRYAKRVQASLTLRCDVNVYPNQELVLGIGHEISWIPPHYLHFDEQEEFGIMDHLKAWVEDSTGEEWDWWPFQQRRCAVRAGDMRVKWQTPCGNPRSIDVPRSVALALQDTLTTAPAFLNLGLVSINGEDFSGNPPKNVSCAHSHASSPGQSRNVPAQASIQQQPSGNRPQPSKQQQQITSAIASNGQAPGFQLQNQTRDPLFVYLCVWKGNKWHMSKLKIHKYVTDAKVFSALKRKYLAKKGAIGRWLSCWQYSYCQFYQFSKYPCSAAPSIVGYPPDQDDIYDFVKPVSPRPSPQTPFGPITQEEFRDRFYTFCEGCCHSWHRKQMRNWLPTLADEERVKVLPKRKEELQWADRKAEAFWGLKVCERICGIRVTAYMVLFNTPAIVFFFLWLFNWTHPSDLQNASVPFFASITLTVAFVSWITRNRKGDLYG